MLKNDSLNDITTILNTLTGEQEGQHRLVFSALYDDLKKIAIGKMHGEVSGHTLQATALVHEAYLRLLSSDSCTWENRKHFFVSAAEVMRRILIDYARRRNRIKRGGGSQPVPLDFEVVDELQLIPESAMERDELLLRLSESLTTFERLMPVKAKVVKLRFFAGMTYQQCAEILGISKATAERYWAFSRAWLHTEIESNNRNLTGVGDTHEA